MPIRSSATTLVAVFFGVAVAVAAAVPAQIVSAEFFNADGPTSSCHASTLVETKQGLVVAWFGGTDEGEQDVGIWLTRHVGTRWSAPVQVVDGVQHGELRYPTWNPVLVQPVAGPLLLFYKCGPSPQRWWGMLTTSMDGGATWSWPRRLPEAILGPVRCKPLQLDDGTLLCGSSTEHEGWRVHFERTPDLGRSWTRTAPLHDGVAVAAIQPTLLRHAGGRLQALCRTRQGRVAALWSSDSGRTWSDIALTELPNPSAGIDGVTLRDGRQLLVYNHTRHGRTPLNVAVSVDGVVWQAALELETAPGEYSYPAVIQSRDGLVHFTYTWKRRRIKHVVVDPTELQPRPMSGGEWPVR